MNPKDEITPEEKLLRLIRRSGRKTPKEKQAEEIAQTKESKFPRSTEPLLASKSPKFKETKIIFAGIKTVNFPLINRLIIFMVIVALILFSFDLYFHSSEIYRPLPSPISLPQKIYLKEKEIKPYSYYQQEISKRNLFKSETLEPGAQKVVPAGPTFKELIKNLRLLGIVTGDNPQIIIEDNSLNKTYFLYTGDYIGEVKVEEIRNDRVILEYKGERVSLFL